MGPTIIKPVWEIRGGRGINSHLRKSARTEHPSGRNLVCGLDLTPFVVVKMLAGVILDLVLVDLSNVCGTTWLTVD